MSDAFFHGANLHAPRAGLLLAADGPNAVSESFGPLLARLATQVASAVGVPGGSSAWGVGPDRRSFFVGAPCRSVAESIAGLVRDANRTLRCGRPLPSPDALVTPVAEAWLDLVEVGCLTEACARRRVPWCFPFEGPTLVMGEGARSRVYHPFALGGPRPLGAVVDDKLAIATLLECAGLPTGRPRAAASASEAARLFREIGGPVVLKPSRTWAQVGVWLDLRTEEDVRRAFQRAEVQAGPLGGGILVERFRPGRSLRVTLVNGRVVAAYEAWAPKVMGDGKRAARDLARAAHGLAEGAAWPARARGVLEATLAKQGLAPGDVPARGRRVSIGLPIHGRKADVTARLHRTLRAALERLARIVPAVVLGVDVLLPRIDAPFDPETCAFVDVNSSPGFIDHSHVTSGERIDVAGAITRALYPRATDARALVVAGTDARLLERAAAAGDGRSAGYTRGRAWSGTPRHLLGEGPRSAALTLLDTSADVLFLAVDDPLAATCGLPVSRIDVWAGRDPPPWWARPLCRRAILPADLRSLVARVNTPL